MCKCTTQSMKFVFTKYDWNIIRSLYSLVALFASICISSQCLAYKYSYPSERPLNSNLSLFFLIQLSIQIKVTACLKVYEDFNKLRTQKLVVSGIDLSQPKKTSLQRPRSSSFAVKGSANPNNKLCRGYKGYSILRQMWTANNWWKAWKRLFQCLSLCSQHCSDVKSSLSLLWSLLSVIYSNEGWNISLNIPIIFRSVELFLTAYFGSTYIKQLRLSIIVHTSYLVNSI